MNDAIIIAGVDGAIERFNAAAERMFGWREGQAIGRNLAEFLPSDDGAPMTFVDVFVRSAQPAGAGRTIECEGARRDGSTFPMEASTAAMLFEDRPTLVAVMRDLTERKAVERKIRHAALHDTLTGLPNRLRFRQLVDEQLDRIKAGERAELTVIGLNLDRFRSINDLFGFRFGDNAIREMGARFRAQLGPGDALARLTGDEFGVLLDGPRPSAAIDSLCDALRGCRDHPVRVDDTHAAIGLRIGLVSIDAADAPDDAQTVIQMLETTLAAARVGGEDGFRAYNPAIGRAREDAVRLERDLRQALERDELTLVYQPKIAIDGGRVVGMEALMRWRRRDADGERDVVSPAEFIPVAEETGLIGPMGEWALREACARTREWAVGPFEGLKCAVNLSPRQFRDARLSDKIRAALDATGLAPGNLELEITESGLIDGVDDVVNLMAAVKAHGVTIAIDDFGTGYSSLSYLKRLPIDVLKIDQSFLRGVPSDGDDVSIVRAVIGLAQALDLKLVAEGVETEAQAAFLRDARCDVAQGYLYARPLAADDFAEFLAAARG